MILRTKLLALLLMVLPAVQACQREESTPKPAENQAAAPADKPPDAGGAAATPADGSAAAPAQGANPLAVPDVEIPPAEELIIWAEGDPDMGPKPLTVKFTVDPIDEVDGGKWEWDFGDNSAKSQEQNPTHTYERIGTFNARVKVTDAAGNVGYDEVRVEVEAEEPKPGA